MFSKLIYIHSGGKLYLHPSGTELAGFQCSRVTVHLQCQACGGMMPSRNNISVPQHCKFYDWWLLLFLLHLECCICSTMLSSFQMPRTFLEWPYCFIILFEIILFLQNLYCGNMAGVLLKHIWLPSRDDNGYPTLLVPTETLP